MIVTNQFTSEAFRPSQYEKTEDGFLRVTARVLAERVMPYGAAELSSLPEHLQSEPIINMVVTRDTMSTGDALRTLEGAQVVAPEHIWVTPDNAGVSKGHAAGAARIDGPYTVIDLVITDPDTIAKIEAGEIGEISAGYQAESVFEDGDFDGQPYQAKQTQLRYNHIAIIPYGEGRAGQDVRIINSSTKTENADPQLLAKALAKSLKDYDKGYGPASKADRAYSEGIETLTKVLQKMSDEQLKQIINNQKSITEGGDKMSVRIRLANTGKFVNVDEETAAALESEQSASEAKTEEAKAESGKKLEELMKEVEELNAQIAELTASSEEAKGELSVYKEKLDELLSDEAAEAQAMAMAAESGEADTIIENMAEDEKKVEEIKNSIGRIANTAIYKLRGTALQTAVLNSVGFKTEGMSAGEVKGAFRTHLHLANSGKGQKDAKRVVAGAGVFQNDGKQVVNAAQDRIAKMWGKK